MSHPIRPREAWRRYVGSIQSRNNIVAADELLYVSTSGSQWNVRDQRDGVYCLSAADGSEIWFTPTTADVNELVFAGSRILAPTDAGDLFVIDRKSGDLVDVHRADGPILGRPVVFGDAAYWAAIYCSLNGSVYQIVSGGGTASKLAEIGSGVRASMVRAGKSSLLIATEGGRVLKGNLNEVFDELRIHEVAEMPEDKWGDARSITATPLVVGDRAFIGYSRTTYDEVPALVCINTESGETLWVAQGVDLKTHFGNVRATPLLIDDTVVLASAYTDGLDLFDAKDGGFRERVILGQNVFQQWSSPVDLGEGLVALGRVNGVCSIVDVRRQALVASISLTTADAERYQRDTFHERTESFYLLPGQPPPDGGICGTPSFHAGRLFVGTTDGVISAIDIKHSVTH